MAYRYALLDPRPTDAARAANDAVFRDGNVYGIEATVSALAARCAYNIDPQHTICDPGPRIPPFDYDRAAIDVALTCELPPDGMTLATIRPDLDSIGAMAVLALRADPARKQYGGGSWLAQPGVSERIRAVSSADRFARGPWPGPRPLPSREDPWPAAQAGAGDTSGMAAIAALVSDSGNGSLSLCDRVAIMILWLVHGEQEIPDLERYRVQVEKERAEMIDALEAGAINVRRVDPAGFAGPPECPPCAGDVAVVTSAHRAATRLGYCVAPVVIAENPRFSLNGGPEHRKVTICAWDTSHCDIRAALAELSALEPGWGGSATIGGSPQGVSTALPIATIVEIVARNRRWGV